MAPSTGAVVAAGNDHTIPRAFMVMSDLVAVAAAYAVASAGRPLVQRLLLAGPVRPLLDSWLPLPQGPVASAPQSFAWVAVVTSCLTILFMDLLGGYAQVVEQSRTRLLLSAVLAPVIALGFVTLAVFALQTPDSSRVFIFTFGATSAIGLVTYRLALRAYKNQRRMAGAYAKNVALIGKPDAITRMVRHFRQVVPPSHYQLVGWLAPNTERIDGVDLPSFGAVDNLGELLINSPIHEVIAVQSSEDRDWLPRVIEDCDYFRVRLRIVPEALLTGNLRDLTLVFRSEPLRLPEIVLSPPHHDSDALFLKRVIDIVLSSTLLVLLSPLLLLIAVAVKLTTPHLPVLYPWRVVGLKGRAFTGYKFTTMIEGAESLRSALLSRNEMSGPVFKVKDDPRVTPLGRFLRKYSLNELPQLWSVVKGDMSLVGPRPAFRHELERYELWHKRKLCVKPGITCIWQVSGRNKISNFDDWVRLDLQYIDDWSLWLDARILARTVLAVVRGTGS